MKVRSLIVAGLAGGFAASVESAAGAVFSPGSVLVMRVGDGNPPGAAVHANVAIQEFSASGTLLQTINLPGGANSSAFTIDRTATSDGTLSWSADRRYLMFAGYSNAAGNGQSSLSFGSGTLRMGARIDNGPTGTGTPEIYQLGGNAGQVRGLTAATETTSYAAKSDGGPRLITNGTTSGTGVILSNTFGGTANFASRQTSIVEGNLYTSYTNTAGASTGTYPGPGIFRYDGLPTTTSATVTRIVTGTSFQSYFFADLDATVAGVDTLYAVDTAGIDIEKYSLVGGTWTANGSIASGGIQNIDGLVTGPGTVTLFGAQQTKLSTLTDSAGYNAANNGTVSDLAGGVPGDNNLFKGIAVVVPEPTSLAFIGLGAASVLFRRRRRA